MSERIFDEDFEDEDFSELFEGREEETQDEESDVDFDLDKFFSDESESSPTEDTTDSPMNGAKDASLGYADAQFNFGNQLHEEDETMSRDSILKSASQGHPQAEYLVGKWFLIGDGVPESEDEAMKYMFRSAKNGCADAQYVLGIYYNDEDRMHYSREIAAYWLELAAAQNNKDAIELLKNFTSMYRLTWWSNNVYESTNSRIHTLNTTADNEHGLIAKNRTYVTLSDEDYQECMTGAVLYKYIKANLDPKVINGLELRIESLNNR